MAYLSTIYQKLKISCCAQEYKPASQFEPALLEAREDAKKAGIFGDQANLAICQMLSTIRRINKLVTIR